MYIRDEIKQAIFDNGGIAIGIVLPKDEKNDVSDEWKENLNKAEFNNLISQIKLCNGIVFQGGICVRVPLCYIIYKYNIGIIGLSIVCGIDRIVRALYLRLYIKAKKQTLFT